MVRLLSAGLLDLSTLAQCAYGLAPSDLPHYRYKTQTWLLTFSRNRSVLDVARRCDHSHVHVNIDGGLRGKDGKMKRRSHDSATYPAALATSIARYFFDHDVQL